MQRHDFSSQTTFFLFQRKKVLSPKETTRQLQLLHQNKPWFSLWSTGKYHHNNKKLYISARSLKTGKRNKLILVVTSIENSTHQKDQPSSNTLTKEKERFNIVVEQIFRTRA